jgi:hypothetical protein
MIQRSGRNKQDGIRAFPLQDLCYFGHSLILQCRTFVEPAHPERDRNPGQSPYIALILELLQPLDGKNAVQVLPGISVVAVGICRKLKSLTAQGSNGSWSSLEMPAELINARQASLSGLPNGDHGLASNSDHL